MKTIKKIKWENMITLALVVGYMNNIITTNRYNGLLDAWAMTDMVLIGLIILASNIFTKALRQGKLNKYFKELLVD